MWSVTTGLFGIRAPARLTPSVFRPAAPFTALMTTRFRSALAVAIASRVPDVKRSGPVMDPKHSPAQLTAVAPAAPKKVAASLVEQNGVEVAPEKI